MSRVARIPGRVRFGGVFTGDTPTLLALFGIGALFTAFTRLDWWRNVLLADATSAPGAVLVLLLVVGVLAWLPLLRRTFVWAEPAVLTWLDFTGTDRVRGISFRVWTGWWVRLLALSYLTTFLGALTALPPHLWVIAAAALAASSVPVLLIAAGGSPHSPRRLPVAVTATRDELVGGWAQRLVRAMGVIYLDPLLLLPTARPVGTRRLRGDPVLRLAVLGVLGRTRFVLTFALLAALSGVAAAVLPGIPDAVLIGVLGFAALVPFAGGIGDLWRSPGLRRWLDGSDLVLRARFALVLGALATVWGLAVLTLVTVLDAPLAASAWLAVPLAAGAVLRCATRPQISYDNLGMTDTPFGQAPVRLAVQVFRGPDLGIIGMIVLAVFPFGWFTCLCTVVLVAWCVLH